MKTILKCLAFILFGIYCAYDAHQRRLNSDEYFLHASPAEQHRILDHWDEERNNGPEFDGYDM